MPGMRAVSVYAAKTFSGLGKHLVRARHECAHVQTRVIRSKVYVDGPDEIHRRELRSNLDDGFRTARCRRSRHDWPRHVLSRIYKIGDDESRYKNPA